VHIFRGLPKSLVPFYLLFKINFPFFDCDKCSCVLRFYPLIQFRKFHFLLYVDLMLWYLSMDLSPSSWLRSLDSLLSSVSHHPQFTSIGTGWNLHCFLKCYLRIPSRCLLYICCYLNLPFNYDKKSVFLTYRWSYFQMYFVFFTPLLFCIGKPTLGMKRRAYRPIMWPFGPCL
jgi:hypothetical protein